jgi:hypothetical protein
MSEVAGAVIAALALLGIPVVTWFSRRATREGRLLLRIERLGAVYALMPPSEERETFEKFLRAAIRDLNKWMDLDSTKRRRIHRWVFGLTYGLGVVASVALVQSVDQQAKIWVSPIAGIGAGVVISMITLLASEILDRRAKNELETATNEKERAQIQARMADWI